MAMWLAMMNFAEGGSLLSIDASLVIVLIIFVVLIVFVNRLVFQPIVKVLDERERHTTGADAEAKKYLKRYEQRLSEYQEKIREARAESYRMLESQRSEALSERGRILLEVKTEVAEKIETKKKEIDLVCKDAQMRLESDARATAESISRNLLNRPLGGVSS